MQLRALGQELRLCVPPDFRDWIESLGIPVTPIGPEVRPTGKARPSGSPPTAEQRRQMMEATVTTQFETITAAARGCDLIVGATALQIAAPSLAEKMGIPYVFAAYCPTVLPFHDLGIGAAHAPGKPTTDSLTSALEHTLQPDVAARARSIAGKVRSDGAQSAAQRLKTLDRRSSS